MTHTMINETKNQQLLKESEERLRLALEAADIGLWEWNLKSQRFTWSENIERLFALKSGTFKSTYDHFLSLIHRDDKELLNSTFIRAIDSLQPYDEEFRVLWPDKNIRWMRIRGNVYPDENGNALRLMGSIHDKTERKLSLEALQNAHNILEKRVDERTKELSDANQKLKAEITQRKKLQKEIMDISEREQQRIGQDLHDSLSQQIGGVIFMSQALREKLSQKALSETNDMDVIIGHLNSALKHTRDLSRGLFPILKEGGLIMALKELALSMEELYDISIDLICDDTIRIKDRDSAIHIFRIIQEALNNAIKHGQAKSVSIRFKIINKRLLLEISDNGTGFPQNPNKKGMGLEIMKYRASMIGAVFKIDSAKGKGTTISCRMDNLHRLELDNNG
ncbi:MAG: PAS domain-containing protein [bacterium]|nr:PAS domain-containing protein [bacterium]